jgi:hypothetical protein
VNRKYGSQTTRRLSSDRPSRVAATAVRKTLCKKLCRYGRNVSADALKSSRPSIRPRLPLPAAKAARSTREETAELAEDIQRRGLARLTPEHDAQ